MGNKDIIIETGYNRIKPKCHILISDFANIVKAFLGSNYLSIAYAFRQSGLVMGLVGLLIIAVVTDHCCDLIVKCKYHAIRLVLDHQKASSLSKKDPEKSLSPFGNSEDESDEDKKEIFETYKALTRNLTYGDIGKLAFGRIGLFIVNACIVFTQFGFCVGYFIFVGNTLFSLLSHPYSYVNSTGTEPTVMSFIFEKANGGLDNEYYRQNSSELLKSVFSHFDIVQINEYVTDVPVSSVSSPSNVTEPPAPVMTGPDLRLLVISPLPLFVGFALLRNIRHLGFVSVCADFSILLGCVITLIYIVIGFELSTSWELVNWTTFPVFFGMVTSSYEGIGTIIPIESSMEGNRHNFSKFLHGGVLILSCLLTVFGTVGYLQNGDSTEQMLNKHIPTSDGIGMAINIFLCVGVLLTFPLQIYPVIEITEIYLFSQGSVCGSKTDSGEDKVRLLSKKNTVMPTPVALTVTDEVSAWKRNLLRLLIVLFAAGIAVLMRDLFAYVNAFIGAIGCSLLAYVLPCFFHLRLCWRKLGYALRVKDISIIVFGIVASFVSLYTTILEVVKKV